MATGLPIAFVFLLINIGGAIFILGGQAGIEQLIANIQDTMTRFSLLPVPLFIFMGQVLFQSKIGFYMIDALDKWIGRLPGRLGLLTVASSTLFSTMSGSNMANTAMLGSLLVPEMQKRGYSKSMTIGPVLGSGGLAMLIPPSTLGVLLAALARVSVGKLLIAGLLPAIVIALLYATYIIGRCYLQPQLAPPYDLPPVPISRRIIDTVRYVLPTGFIIFLVIGVIILGIATPSEAAALGSVGIIFLALAYRRMNWGILKRCILATTKTTVMVFMVILGSMSFSQILAFSGASESLIKAVTSLSAPPIILVIAMLIVLLFLGCFMDNLSMVMIALPVYLPLIDALELNPLWFLVMMLINMEMAGTTPPFGLLLFVMKSVAPKGTSMADIYKAGIPFLVCDAIAMSLILVFPPLATWLSSRV
jgi:tripartite ATP-independent transporter DctM subunit